MNDLPKSGFFLRSVLAALLAVLVQDAFADSTDASWQYVSPIPAEWRAGARPGSFDATGVITNGDYRLFVKKTGSSLSLSSYSGNAEYINGGAYLSGSGQLDLSKPIYVEGTDERLFVTVMPIHNFSGVSAITEFIAPPELTTLKGYNFYTANGVNPQMTNVVFNCPGLTYIGDGVFRFCSNLTRITIRSNALGNIDSKSDVGTFAYMSKTLQSVEIATTNKFKYGPCSFAGDKMSKLSVDAFSLDYATSVGKYALMSENGSGMTGAVNLASLTTVGEQAFRFQKFSKVLLGYDALDSVGKEAFFQCGQISLFVIGSGSAPLVLKKDVFSHASGSGPKYRVFFRGDAPDASQLASGEYAFYDDLGDKRGRFYIPYGNASWDTVVSAAEPCTQAEFNADYPDDDAPVIGLIPSRTIGNRGKQYLCYGDYRAEESDLIVTAQPQEIGAVSPAYGRSWQYAAGDTVPLVAPDGVVTNGATLLKVSSYVVETIDRLGRWTNPVTNAYEKGVSSVTLPASGASLRVTWLFEAQHRVSLAPLMSADYPEEVTCDRELDAEGCAYISEGDTVTFTARAESPELPKTRFVRWEGDIGEADATNNVLTLTMDQARRVKAVFSHGWHLTSATRMTDGVWTLYVNKLSDDSEGRHRLCLGDTYESWAVSWVSYEGSLGVLDLSSRIEDDSGNDYVITMLSACSLRGDSDYSGKIGGTKTLKDLTLPPEVTSAGSHLFLGHTALTNAVVDCPKLKSLPQGFLRGCTALRRVYLKIDNVTSMGGSADYTPLRACNDIRELYVYAPSLKVIPKYFAAATLSQTDVSNWRLDSVTNIQEYAFDNSGLSSGGPTGTLNLPALECLTGAKQFYGWTRLSEIRLGSGRLRNLGTEATSTQQMTGLRRIELGLAVDNTLHNRLFESVRAGTLTNVTFTAAPPASGDLFASFATHYENSTGAKQLTMVADFDQPGWTDDYLAAMGIDAQPTDGEAAELAKLPHRERRWFRGVVWTPKRYAWLFAKPKKLGLMMLVR